MTATTLLERMYMYHQTTLLPLSALGFDGRILHQIGIPDKAGTAAADLPLEKLKTASYGNFSFHPAAQYIAVKIPLEGFDEGIVMAVGPFRYDVYTKEEQEQIRHALRDGTMKEYLARANTLPMMKRGATNQHYKMLELIFTGEKLLFNDIDQDLPPLEKMEDCFIEYREIDYYHKNYSQESEILSQLFRNRSFSLLSGTLDDLIMASGTVSLDDKRNTKNLLIVAVALMARKAIELGVETHIALTTSDSYIRQLERLEGLGDMELTCQSAFRTFYKSVGNSRARKYPRAICEVLSYIDENLANKITLEDAAERVGLSQWHLSKTFRGALGMTFSDYVMKQKITEAKRILQFSHNSLADITGILGFSSKSYFVKCFKKVTGMTPGEFQNSRSGEIESPSPIG